MATEWEYKDFVWPWPSSLGYRVNAFYPESRHRLEFWQSRQNDISFELQKWLDQGWQPIGEVGPASIQLSFFDKAESNVDCSRVIMWGFSLGIGLLIDIVTGNLSSTYTYCRADEFRLKMRMPRT